MPTYQLNFTLTAQQVQLIASTGQYLTIAKQNPAANNPPYNVAWVAFVPTTSDVVSWVENYSVYATETAMQQGATIVLSDSQPANAGDNWEWNGTLFSGPGSLGSQAYGIQNQAQNPPPGSLWSFGLAQEHVVNGVTTSAPLNIVSAIYNEQLTFTPIETVYVFLSEFSNNGCVITAVTNTALEVQLTSVSPSANIVFNSTTDQFQLAG